MVPKEGPVRQAEPVQSSAASAQGSGSRIIEEEKSEEVREVERKIERLLQRVKQPQAAPTVPAAVDVGTAQELPHSIKVPGTIRPHSRLSPTASPTSGHREKTPDISSGPSTSATAQSTEPLRNATTLPHASALSSSEAESSRTVSKPTTGAKDSAPEVETPLASTSLTAAAMVEPPQTTPQAEATEITQDDEEEVSSQNLEIADDTGAGRAASIQGALIADRQAVSLWV